MDITDSNFKEKVIERSKDVPVIVDFWASWCGPCLMLKPIMDKLASEYKDKVDIVKLSVEENQQTASEYGIMSIPAVKMFKGGKVVDEFLGARPEQDVREWIDSNL